MLATISILVQGKVQGVFFRQSTKSKADALHITGFVKNNKEGTVSVVATGEETSLQILTDWCKKGPPRALVSNVMLTDMTLTYYNDFQIIK
jgi:acylphosphatase